MLTAWLIVSKLVIWLCFCTCTLFPCKPIQNIYPQLTTPRKVVTSLCTRKPDADAMGSVLGCIIFAQFGHTVYRGFLPTTARWINWMPAVSSGLWGAERVKKAEALLDDNWMGVLPGFQYTQPYQEYGRVITSPRFYPHTDRSPPATGSSVFCLRHQRDTGKSSTCEMVYDFIIGSDMAIVLPLQWPNACMPV